MFRSAVGLWDHSHVRRFDDGAGIGSFGDCRANSLTNFLMLKRGKIPQSGWVASTLGNGGRALHIPPVEPVSESVPCFSFGLGGVHNLASDTC